MFSWFGEQQHHVFDYKPRYYDKQEEERKRKFGSVDGSDEKKPYEPGSYVRGSMRGGAYSREKGHANKAQNIIGLIGLLLIAIVLVFIAKFYTIL